MSSYSSSPNFKWGHPTPGPQSPTSQEVMDHLFFVSNTEWKAIREGQQFDYIIIGSGFCGLAFVERVLKNNPAARVLLLERGGFFLPEHFQNLPLMFKSTLGGLSETFPWSLSDKTFQGKHVRFQYGMVPFFGGRSTVWSGWCPRPTEAEMIGWPEEIVMALPQYYTEAESLLNVIPADKISSTSTSKPVYGQLQKRIQERLNDGIGRIGGLTRTMPAPMAVKNPDDDEVDFAKFSVPNVLFNLVEKQRLLSLKGKGAPLMIAANCIANKILQEDGKAIAIDTSRGIVKIGDAKVICAMGSLPVATFIRNSFPQVKNIGKRYTTHFISSIVARIPRKHFGFDQDLSPLELGAFYVAGIEQKLGHQGQFHIQLTALSDIDPGRNALKALRNMPDVVATATLEQLASSGEHVVFVCAVLGELSYKNQENWFRKNDSPDLTTNSTLQITINADDEATWLAMDEATFQILEQAISPRGVTGVEYWNNSKSDWDASRPAQLDYRNAGTVHDASTMWIGKDEDAPVDVDFRPRNVKNVYITGSALWPTGASWNPTLTMVALAQQLADNLSKIKG